MHHYYDDNGNSRGYSGEFSSSGTMSSDEQYAAGVGHYDSPSSAWAKVQLRRMARGANPHTGLTDAEAAAIDLARSSGDGRASGRFLKITLLVGIALVAASMLPIIWKESGSDRFAISQAIEAWGLRKAIAGEGFAPFSAYGAYIPKGAAPLDSKPMELNERAKRMFSGKKKVSDETILRWGPAAWKCLSENPACLAQAGVFRADPGDIRLLGLRFLEIARAKGSPDAVADMGLYLLSNDSPIGPDARLASSHWIRGAEENPKAVRSARMIESAKASPWVSFSARAAALIRGEI